MPLGIVVLKRADIAAYERIVEGIKARTRADVRVFDVDGASTAGRVKTYLDAHPPGALLVIGQQVYDLVRDWPQRPLLYAYVFHRPKPSHVPVPITVPVALTLQLIRTAFPNSHELEVLISPDQQHTRSIRRLTREATRTGFTIHFTPAADPQTALRSLRRSPHDASTPLWLWPNTRNLSPQVVQYAVAQQFRLHRPLIGASASHVRRGALFAADIAPDEVGRRAAAMLNTALEHTGLTQIARDRASDAARTDSNSGFPAARITVNVAAAARLDIAVEFFGRNADLVTEG